MTCSSLRQSQGVMLVRHQGLIKLFKITSVSHTCKKMDDVHHNFVTNLNLMRHLTRKLVPVAYAKGIFKRLFSHSVLIKLARAQAAQQGIHFF